MDRYLVLKIDCAECREPDDPTLVTVLANEPTLRDARVRADQEADWFVWVNEWKECDDGWYASAGNGELRIIYLGSPDRI